MYWLLITFLIIWLILSIFAYVNVSQIIKKYEKYQKIENLPQTYNGFLRRDFRKWNKSALIKGCFLRFPLNTILTGSFLAGTAFLANINAPPKLIDIFRNTVGRLSLLFYFNLTENQNVLNKIKTPIAISNHVSWTDIIYFGSCFQTLSFVAKKQTQTMPIIASIVKYSKAILVDRSSLQAKKQSLQDIKNRVEMYKSDPDHTYPIMIFPEGTTSNSFSLMRFSNGAFENLAPITLFSLRYECQDFNMGMDQISNAQHFFLSACIRSKLTVKREEIFAQDMETIVEYRERCRNKIGKMGGFKLEECSFSDIRQYQKMRRELKDKKIK